MHIFSTRCFWLSRRQTVNIQNDNEKDEKVKTKHFKTTWFMPLNILILRLGLLVSSLLIVSIPLKVTISGRNVRTSGELWQLWSFTPLVYYNGQVHPLTVWNCACIAQTVEAGKVWRKCCLWMQVVVSVVKCIVPRGTYGLEWLMNGINLHACMNDIGLSYVVVAVTCVYICIYEYL